MCIVDVAIAYQQGHKPEEIQTYVSSRPLTLAEVMSALACHFDHPEELEEYLRREAEAEKEYEARRARSLRQRPAEWCPVASRSSPTRTFPVPRSKLSVRRGWDILPARELFGENTDDDVLIAHAARREGVRVRPRAFVDAFDELAARTDDPFRHPICYLKPKV